MGYYVKITNCEGMIKKDEKPYIFKQWCDLNKPENDNLKFGGSYSGGKKSESWYSWMDSDYDKTCTCMEEILGMLGFDFSTDKDGNIFDLTYDSKTGQEALFFEKAAPYISQPLFISWVGEDDEKFSWIIDEGNFFEGDEQEYKILKEQKKLNQQVPSGEQCQSNTQQFKL